MPASPKESRSRAARPTLLRLLRKESNHLNPKRVFVFLLHLILFILVSSTSSSSSSSTSSSYNVVAGSVSSLRITIHHSAPRSPCTLPSLIKRIPVLHMNTLNHSHTKLFQLKLRAHHNKGSADWAQPYPPPPGLVPGGYGVPNALSKSFTSLSSFPKSST